MKTTSAVRAAAAGAAMLAVGAVLAARRAAPRTVPAPAPASSDPAQHDMLPASLDDDPRLRDPYPSWRDATTACSPIHHHFVSRRSPGSKTLDVESLSESECPKGTTPVAMADYSRALAQEYGLYSCFCKGRHD